jgi:hypothetical protein
MIHAVTGKGLLVPGGTKRETPERLFPKPLGVFCQRLTLPELFLGAEDRRVCERKRSPHHLSALTHRLWHKAS